MAQSTVESVGLALDTDGSRITALLPEAWQDKARALGAFRRARLGELAQIRDVAILKRLRGCGAWFEWMCRELRRQWLPEPLSPVLASCWSGRRIRLIDATMLSEPGLTGSQWPLHYSVDFPSLRADEVIVSPRVEGETLKRFTLSEGDIVVADRGFAKPAGVAHVAAGGGAVVVRMNLLTLPLFECSGVATDQGKARTAWVRIDVLKLVRTLGAGQCASWPATVHHSKRAVVGRLCAVKNSAASAQKARERVRRESQRGGSQLQAETLEAADYVLVFTTAARGVCRGRDHGALPCALADRACIQAPEVINRPGALEKARPRGRAGVATGQTARSAHQRCSACERRAFFPLGRAKTASSWQSSQPRRPIIAPACGASSR